MSKKLISFLVVAALVVGIVIGLVFAPNQESLKGTNENRLISFDEGIAVDNTTVIDGTGSFTIASGQSITVNGTTTVGVLDADRITFGGVVSETVAGGTSTLTAADLCDGGIINLNYGLAQATATLPTAASLIADCTPTVGEWHETLLRNTSGTANYATIVAGASSTLETISASSTANKANIYGGEEALLRWIYVNSASGGTVDMFMWNFSDI